MCVSLNYNELSNNYLIIVGDNVNIRIEPNIKSEIILKLNIGDKVKVLKRLNNKIIINGAEGIWIYIDSCRYKNDNLDETIKGWVFSNYAVSINQFKLLNNICQFQIVGWVGDYLLSYNVYGNGSYKRKIYDYDHNKYISGITGRIYKFNRVLLALDNDKKGYEIFYFVGDNKICSPKSDMDGKYICAECRN